MSELLETLNDQQRNAVTAKGAPLLIIAGAGTGKTTVITRKIAYLIEQGLAKPDEILALTFTEKAAGEMIDRVEALLPNGYFDLWISTFHSFCERVLRDHGLSIGIPHRFEILDTTGVWHLMYEHFAEFDLDYYRPRGNPTQFLQAMISHFSRAKDEAITPQEYLDYAESVRLNSDTIEFEEENKRLTEIANAYHTHNRILLEYNKLDFGDMLMYVYELLKTRPMVAAELRNKFKYILVDEFQDTNWIQYAIVKALGGDGSSLTVVADDDQSIYKFRGASVSNVMEFVRDFPNRETVTLTHNYRSCQEILDLAYHFISNNNPNRLEVQVTDPPISKKLIANNKSAAEISCVSFVTHIDESTAIAQFIREKIESGISPDEIAILIRSNSQADAYVAALERVGIPVMFHSRSGLYKDPIVLDILAYLLVLVDPHESTAFHRVLRLPSFLFPHEDLQVVYRYSAQYRISFFDAFKKISDDVLSKEGVKHRAALLKILSLHSAVAKTEKPSHLIIEFLDHLHYSSFLNQSDDKEKTFSLLSSFLEHTKEFEEKNPACHVSEFLDYIRLTVESGDEGSLNDAGVSGNGAVSIMTIHRSKGLEFEYVYIPGLVALRFPSISRKDQIELPTPLIKEVLPEGDIHLEEERRLMYVALTRAKRGLCISYAGNYGGKQLKKPSIFVKELGLGLSSRARERDPVLIEMNEVKNVDVSPQRPTSFSYTALKTFNDCPLQYYYREILKIPTRGAGSKSLGVTIHATLEAFYVRMKELNAVSQSSLFDESTPQELKIVALDELMDLYREKWIDEWYANTAEKEKARKDGAQMLRAWYASQEGKWNVPHLLEQKFRLKLGPYTLRGQIDRIDTNKDGVRIVDYKTGKSKNNDDLETEDKQQLYIYQIAAEEALGLHPTQLSYMYLKDGNEVSFIGKNDDLVKLKTKLMDRMEQIQESDFKATPSEFTCGRCDYRDICEFRK